jgi:hypothetical protein
MHASILDTIRARLAVDSDFRERLRHAFGRTLASEGYLALLSIEQVAALYALVYVPDLLVDTLDSGPTTLSAL